MSNGLKIGKRWKLNKSPFFITFASVLVCVSLVFAVTSSYAKALSRKQAADMISNSGNIQELRTKIYFYGGWKEKAKKEGVLKGCEWRGSLLMGEEYCEFTDPRLLAMIKKSDSSEVQLRQPVSTPSIEVTGMTDASFNMKEVHFSWKYRSVPSPLNRFIISGGTGTVLIRLYDDGWRLESFDLKYGKFQVPYVLSEAEKKEEQQEMAIHQRDEARQREEKLKQEESDRIAREREQEAQRAIKAGHEAFKHGLYPEGISELERAWQLGSPAALNNLAWHFATCKDPTQHNGKKAVELALKATKLNPANAEWLDTLAAAYARNGEFDQAVSTQVRALSMDYIDGGKYRLELYRQHKPYQKEN